MGRDASRSDCTGCFGGARRLFFPSAVLQFWTGQPAESHSWRILAAVLRALIDRHAAAEERAILLAHEMAHRTANLLGIVQSIATQTKRTASSVEDYHTRLSARLEALAHAQKLVSANPKSNLDLEQLLRLCIQPFDPSRFSIIGPKVEISPVVGSSCALLFHELGTNALKYGSLSQAAGSVKVNWVEEQNRVTLIWKEAGGPPVQQPSRTGFGSRLLQMAFPPSNGDANINFNQDGVECCVSFDAA